MKNIVFQPPKPSTYSENGDWQVIFLPPSPKEDKEHTIASFFIDNQSDITVLYSHGNGEDIGCMHEWLTRMGTSMQVNVLAYDYVGYGLSRVGRPAPRDAILDSFARGPPSPSEDGCYDAIDAAFSYLTDIRRIPTGQ